MRQANSIRRVPSQNIEGSINLLKAVSVSQFSRIQGNLYELSTLPLPNEGYYNCLRGLKLAHQHTCLQQISRQCEPGCIVPRESVITCQ